MIKNIFSIFISALFFVSLSGQGIDFFNGTFEEALAKSKEEDKVLFIDAYATWCGPCKRMSKYVFTEESVGSFFNKNFINLKLDMEKRDGVKFGKKYPVSAFPTLIFLDPDGNVLKKVKGAQEAEGLIQLGKLALQGYDKSAQYAELYEKGNREFSTVYNYVKALNSAGKPSLKIANEYLNEDPDLTPEQIALFSFEAATEADSRIFDLMLEHKQTILASVPKEEYRQKVVRACSATLNKAIMYDMEMLKDETHEKCKRALDEKEADLENLKFDMIYYSQMENLDAYLKATDEIAKKYADKDLQLYRFIIEDINEKFKDVDKATSKGVKYGEKLFKKEDTPDNAVLYVRMLIATKDYKKGLEVIDKAIEKAGETTSDGQKLKSIRRYVESLNEDNS